MNANTTSFRRACAVHKDCRSPKYRPRTEAKLKGKGSFRRDNAAVQREVRDA